MYVADEPRPEEYPWAPAVRGCLLTESGEFPVRTEPGRGIGSACVTAGSSTATVDELLAREGVAPLAERTLVVAIGSNASPAVIAGKYARAASGCPWATPFLTGTLHGVAVGHSAHVSRRGYIPAAPYARRGAATRVVAAWFDDAQLAAVDATEPNYDRVALDTTEHPLVLDSEERPHSIAVYASRHGLIGATGTADPIAFGTQCEVFAELSDATGDPRFSGTAGEVCLRLAEPDARALITADLHAGPTVPHGLVSRA
ncbi:hypothetical protein ARHIZOSPH14_13760 [Agromyces rhizosphaerae]|uniref:Uncharacterized protein n=1 Tax=Agromyces rhizosphaerae TaxID=88374 RepID=A0A9W6FNM5_9MICO|nr:hypothetical protein [Agromyces rhizosphaerae]GLI27134.1 hypothetical protein ARHIZOSPH14_13760 [Agromyces rhizosphaerae]